MKKIFAAFIALCMLPMTAFANSECTFTDISRHWAKDEIEYAYENNMVSGYPDNTFKPNNTVSRAEFLKLMTASLCENLELDISEFADETHWVSKYYNFSVAAQLLECDDTVSYDGISPAILTAENSNTPIKRWEMAYILNSFIVKLFGADIEPADYTDSAETVQNYGEKINDCIGSCIALGFLNGNNYGEFKAANAGTRAEAVAIVNRFDRYTKYVISMEAAEGEIAESFKEYEVIPEGHPQVEIELENGGKFTVELYPEYAPQTVANFVELAKNGSYDGTKFHRVIEGFVAQGGALTNGNTAEYIKGEFEANGVDNPLKHERGVISMARAQANNSASSQFFICYADLPSLDGSYAAFGKVTEGMEVIDAFLTAGLEMSEIGELSVPVNDIIIKKATVIE